MMEEDDERTRSLLGDEDRIEVDLTFEEDSSSNKSSSGLFGKLRERLSRRSSSSASNNNNTNRSSGTAYAAIALDDSPRRSTNKQPARSESEKAMIRARALKRQRENNKQFMQNLKKEEEEIMAEIRRRKEQEARDAELAMRMQFGSSSSSSSSSGSSSSSSSSIRPIVRVTCPRNRLPGDCVTVSIPQIALIATRIPEHTQPGQEFSFRYDERNAVRVQFKVPNHLGPSRRIELSITEGKYLVTVPLSARSGETLLVRLMKPPRYVSTQVQRAVVPPPAVTQQKIDPSFLAALPPDIREELMRTQGIEQQVAALSSVTSPPVPSTNIATSKDVSTKISTKEVEEVEEEEEEEDLMGDLFSGMSVREDEEEGEKPKVEVTIGASPQVPTTTTTSAPPLERLRTAKKMFEEGLINQDEFNELKAEILGDLKS